jgi:hypothetical protein
MIISSLAAQRIAAIDLINLRLIKTGRSPPGTLLRSAVPNWSLANHRREPARRAVSEERHRLAVPVLSSKEALVAAVLDLLARHGWRKLMPRPHHPQRDLAAQQDFKKMRLSTSCKAGSARGRKLWVLFADEARFGWMNRPRPCWALEL